MHAIAETETILAYAYAPRVRFACAAALRATARANYPRSPSFSLSLSQGIKFTDNVVADPDLASACTGASLLVFVLPHQFLGRICPQMTTMTKGCRALSLIKGIEFEEGGPILISNMIKEQMNGMDVSVLMGANVANEGARAKALPAARARRRGSTRLEYSLLPPSSPPVT